MRILLDECLPKRLDRNLSFQQPIGKFKIAVVVLIAKSNKYARLQPLVPKVLEVLATAPYGQVVKVGA